MLFRIAVPSDAPALFELNEAFNGKGCNAAGEIKKRLGQTGGEVVVVAEEEGRIIGFCCAQCLRSVCYAEPFGQLTELYTAPEARRRGAARGMIALMEKVLASLGVREVFLLTDVDNLQARHAYEASGYEGGQVMMYEKRLAPERMGTATEA